MTPYAVRVPLRWSDMDAYAHVNNVQFLRLLEDARVLGFRSWFGPGPSMLDQGVVVSRHEIEYHAPLVYRPEPVQVRMWVTATSAAGFTVGYEITDPAEVGSTTYALAETALVLYDFESARPRRMSPEERAQSAAHLGDPVPFRWGRS